MKLLIATAGYGAGHNAAARHLETGLREEFPEVAVQIVDPIANSFGRVDVQARKFYLGMINRTPRLWQKIYEIVDRHPKRAVNGPGKLFLGRGIRRLITLHSPDIWVSTFPVYNYFLDRLKMPLRHATIVTDSLSVNHIWTRCRPHPFITPNRATADVLIAQGIDPALVHPLGFPVPPFLDTPVARPPIRDGLRVLYIVNGALPMAEGIVESLAALPRVHATIITGNHARLLGRLQRTHAGHPRLTLLGWTKNVPELMQQHHVLISKAGGATVQEAIAAGIPMIVNQVIPGQEAGNWQLLDEATAGVALEDAASIGDFIARLTEARYAKLSRAVASLQTPHAARNIARFLMTLLPPARTA